jgi:hypothetical protein
MKRSPKTGAASLREAHIILLAALKELDSMIRSDAPITPARWLAVLEPLRGDVDAHFAMEEDGGYMDGVVSRHPEWERQVREIQDEHRRLSTALGELIAKAGAGEGQEEAFRESLRGWIHQIRQHEARESRLVEDAFNLDLGTED